MAGVQQLTRAPDAQAADETRARHAVTLTDKQSARPIDHRSSRHVREAQRTKTHARRVQREHAQQGAHEAEARHAERVRKTAQSEQSDHSGSASQSGSHHDEARHQTHVSAGGHDGGHAGGHGGD